MPKGRETVDGSKPVVEAGKDCKLEVELPAGVFIRGVVTGRRRERVVARDARPDDKGFEKVTYRIKCDKVEVMVEEFDPSQYFVVGEPIEEPIVIRTFCRRNGTAAYGLTLARSRPNERGEEF